MTFTEAILMTVMITGPSFVQLAWWAVEYFLEMRR